MGSVIGACVAIKLIAFPLVISSSMDLMANGITEQSVFNRFNSTILWDNGDGSSVDAVTLAVRDGMDVDGVDGDDDVLLVVVKCELQLTMVICGSFSWATTLDMLEKSPDLRLLNKRMIFISINFDPLSTCNSATARRRYGWPKNKSCEINQNN